MSLVIKFESNQDYQTEAIESVVDLFDGVPSDIFEADSSTNIDDEQRLFAESLFPNKLPLHDESVRELVWENLQRIQARMRQGPDGEQVPVIPLEARSTKGSDDPLTEFSVEMETGTGKTYVYLRTAIELYRRYGLSKFVIVVPSVAIREGVLSTLRATAEHFRELYGDLTMDHYVYDSSQLNRLRQFATTNHLQILVMNIAAFQRDDNVIRRPADGLNGRAPIEFIKAVHPIVIMDEPQKLGSEAQEEAIADLDPLFRLRYSATHRNHHHRLYRLSPLDAYNMRLVKRIDVLSVTPPDNQNVPFVEVKKITATSSSVRATLVINKSGGKKQEVVDRNDDLRVKSKLDIYNGWVVEEIKAPTDDSPGHVEFQNGRLLRVGSSTGVDLDLWHRELIRAAIDEHLQTELRLLQLEATGGIHKTKPLTLFFIDKVANYVADDAKFRVWFEEEYEGLRRERRFRQLSMPMAPDVHRGYFASTRGVPKDSKAAKEGGRSTKDDEDAFDLIMRDKERLLSIEEPVRFIFSHSALAEGWDNPNVFTICNLQQVQSEVKRRQQIGRGLRLPFMANGERCRVDEVNHLTVIANEEFEKFAAGLQKDIQDETGVPFRGLIKERRSRIALVPRDGFTEFEGFRELWDHIARRSTYRLAYGTDDIVEEAGRRLRNAEPIAPPRFQLERHQIKEINHEEGLKATARGMRSRGPTMTFDFPDILGEVVTEVPVSRATVKRVINNSNKLSEARKNPAQFRRQVVDAVRGALAHTLRQGNGIQYTPRDGDDRMWSMDFFTSHHAEAYEDNLVEVSKSIYDRIPVDSEIERRFALDLDQRDDVVLFVKLPSWFKVDTPVGGYNPDWAIVRKMADDLVLYIVRETKGTSNPDDLFREHEVWKVTFGSKHFDAIGVDYRVVTKASQLDVELDRGNRVH